jgi:hypothetical protein
MLVLFYVIVYLIRIKIVCSQTCDRFNISRIKYKNFLVECDSLIWVVEHIMNASYPKKESRFRSKFGTRNYSNNNKSE